MKRILVLILSLSLLFGAAAMAQEITSDNKSASVSVTYTIEANQNFVVTIPATVSLTPDASGKLTGELQVSLEAPEFNDPEHKIELTMRSQNGYSLKNENTEGYLDYDIYWEDGTLCDEINPLIFAWYYGQESASTTMSISAEVVNVPYGKYADTLTFSASITDAVSSDGNTEYIPL